MIAVISDLPVSIPEMIPIREVCSRIPTLSYEYVRSLCLQNRIVYIKTGCKYLINFGKLCSYLNGETGDRGDLHD